MTEMGLGDFYNEQGPTWIADLIFQRHNISVKYVANGNILILAEMAKWEDIQPRLMKNFGWMLTFVLSIVFNFILLLISLSKARQLYHKKIKCLVANLAFCNIILSLGSLIYTFLVDVYYDVDSFETLIRLNEGVEFAPLWSFAKQIVHSEMVENFALAQTLILFMMGVDRYLSLFDGYSPSVKRPFWFCALSVVPYFFSLLVFDYRIMVTQVNGTVAHLTRLVALIAPILLSVVFTGCSVVRLVQKQSSGGTNARDELFFSMSLLVILMVQTAEKFGLFLELLKTNFMFDIVIGEEESDQLLSDVLHSYYQGFVKSKRVRDVLTHDNHLFWKNKQHKQTIYWECVKADECRCKAGVSTNSETGTVLKIKGIHNHDKSALAVPLRMLNNQIKQKAAETMETPSQIFNQMVRQFPEAVLAKVNKSAKRKVVQRKRKRENDAPAGAIGWNFEIPAGYKNYQFAMNEPDVFLLADEVDVNGKRILIFGRSANKSWSGRMKIVFMDGTFSITPDPFSQVYVILAERDGFVFPVLYVLLPDKSQASYEQMFQIIRKMWPEFQPSSVSIDFEQAVINSLRTKFSNEVLTEDGQAAAGPQVQPLQIWGCFFHLVQNMKKKLGKHHLKSRYDKDTDFAVTCRMITAMAFVPLDDLIQVFDELWELMPLELEPLMLYFQKNYIGSVIRRGTREIVSEPKFAHSLWNVYERTLNGDHRTNNYAEAANHRIQSELNVCHPGLWNFINGLKTVQQGRDQLFLQWQLGKQAKGKRTVYKEADARILRIVQSYAIRNTEEYLKGIANNYVMED